MNEEHCNRLKAVQINEYEEGVQDETRTGGGR